MNASDIAAQRHAVARPLVALLATVFLGILAMHVLAAHCSPTGNHTSRVATASVVSHHSDAASAGADHDTHSGLASVDVPGRSAQEDERGDHLGIVGSCIATLAGLALVLAAARARAIRGCWQHIRHIAPNLLPLRSRLSRSFSLTELCLQRC